MCILPRLSDIYVAASYTAVHSTVQIILCFGSLLKRRRHLEIPDVGEEEADEGEGQVPFRHRADDMSRVAL